MKCLFFFDSFYSKKKKFFETKINKSLKVVSPFLIISTAVALIVPWGAKTFSITTLSITTFSITTLSITTISITTISITTFSVMTHSVMTLSTTTRS